MMKAVFHLGIRQIAVVKINRPKPSPGMVLIKVGAVGICGTDLHGYRKDETKHDKPDGHEYSGIIVEVGDGVPLSRIGQHVTVDSFLNSSCGVCEFCVSGKHFHCINKDFPFRTGGFAEYVCVKDSATFNLPDLLDDALGALVEPLAVGVHAVRQIGVKPGMIGVVVGAGSIGLLACIAALDAGAERMFLVAKHDFQKKIANSIGADVLPTDFDEAFRQVVQSKTHGVDFVIEAVGGSMQTIDLACQFCRPMGTVGIVGAFNPEFNGVKPFMPLIKELSFRFSNCYGYRDGIHDFEIAIDILARKGNNIRKLITHEFLLEEAENAFKLADNKSSGAVKVIIKS